MQLINDPKDPDLVAILDDPDEMKDIQKWVNNTNRDLVDSGFAEYQYEAVRKKDKAYIVKV